MSTATLPAVQNGYHPPAIPETRELTPETLERVMLEGDLSKLRPEQRLEWYRARCDAAGLDPRGQPFQYLLLNGKLVLYATKAATEQLTGIHKLGVAIVGRETDRDTGLHIVQARVTFPDGRTVDDCGAVCLTGLKGEALANAVLKATTKAKRRTVLSALGLGMLDESEVEAVAGARRVSVEPTGEIVDAGPVFGKPEHPQNDSGHGRGEYASPDQVNAYNAALKGFIDKANAKWADQWTGPEGPIDGIPELINPWQANAHLLKWAVDVGYLDASIVPEDVKTRKPPMYLAIVYHRSKGYQSALAKELAKYVDEQAARKTEKLYRERPELDPDHGVDADPDDLHDNDAREPGQDG